MNRQNLPAIAITLTTLFVIFPAAALDWTLKGDWTETCCCQPACPCVFESAPTLGHCEGSALFEIDEGRYGNVSVDGLATALVYRLGEWIRVYVDESASDAQVEAVTKLLNQPDTFGGLFGGDVKVHPTERVPFTIEKSDSKVAYAIPDASAELELMTGANDEPVEILNLTVPWFVNGYTQYTATKTRFERGDEVFEYSGTNGATSYVEASGTEG